MTENIPNQVHDAARSLRDMSPSELMWTLSRETCDASEGLIVAVGNALFRCFQNAVPNEHPMEICGMILAFAEMTQDQVAIARMRLWATLIADDSARLEAA